PWVGPPLLCSISATAIANTSCLARAGTKLLAAALPRCPKLHSTPRPTGGLMKKLILTGALSATALLLSGCGDNDADTVAEDTTTIDPTTADTSTMGSTTTGSADWPSGTRIEEEAGTTFRVDSSGTRTAIENNEWRIESE